MLYMHFPKSVHGCEHVFFAFFSISVSIESFRSSKLFESFRDTAYKIYKKLLIKKKIPIFLPEIWDKSLSSTSLKAPLMQSIPS